MAKSKREIDKEIMFNKIMPSGVISNAQEERSEAATGSSQLKAEPVQDAPVKSNVLSSEIAIKFKDKEPTVVVNIIELFVLDRLDAAFAKFNCCKCDRCKKDVIALALNKLKPKYVVTEQNKINSYATSQTNIDVSTAIVQAIITVKANPRH
ncbi:MAG: late competence development ComFB family protein [Angelakisella sp.]|nr:late competence development ComFB family protein [Angelakisella sp.]